MPLFSKKNAIVNPCTIDFVRFTDFIEFTEFARHLRKILLSLAKKKAQHDHINLSQSTGSQHFNWPYK